MSPATPSGNKCDWLTDPQSDGDVTQHGAPWAAPLIQMHIDIARRQDEWARERGRDDI